MTDAKIQAAISSSIIGLTRHEMEVGSVTDDEAFRTVYKSEMYKLLTNPDTRLYLEPNAELIRLYDIERMNGVDTFHSALIA